MIVKLLVFFSTLWCGCLWGGHLQAQEHASLPDTAALPCETGDLTAEATVGHERSYASVTETYLLPTDTARLTPDTLITPLTPDSRLARLLNKGAVNDSLKIIPPTGFSPCFWHPLPQALCFAGIGLGVWGLGHRTWFFRKKRELREEFKRLRGNRYFHADDYIQYAPAATFISLGKMAFIPHRHRQSERFLIGTTAFAVMGVLVNSLKHTIDARRPDGSAHNSFPSGHTATAFVGAELTRLEYGNYYGLGAYLMATTVGVLRMYNNRHWLNDVVAGAGIGVLSAHVADWLFPIQKRCINRIFCKKQPPKAANAPSTADTSSLWVLPSYSAENRAPQLSLQLTF